ncbi:MAG: PhoH family protein, partial [Burkholderiaceae bacterium]|nr:PhoH family protein [Burkholderiaceae bacterium]
MPLPKPPGKPATLLDLSSAVEARAARPTGARPPKPERATAHEVVPMRAAPGAGAKAARTAAAPAPARAPT